MITFVKYCKTTLIDKILKLCYEMNEIWLWNKLMELQIIYLFKQALKPSKVQHLSLLITRGKINYLILKNSTQNTIKW